MKYLFSRKSSFFVVVACIAATAFVSCSKEDSPAAEGTEQGECLEIVYDCDFIDDGIENIPNAQLKHVIIDGEEVYHS